MTDAKDELKELRMRSGLTYEQLGEILGARSGTQLVGWETAGVPREMESSVRALLKLVQDIDRGDPRDNKALLEPYLDWLALGKLEAVRTVLRSAEVQKDWHADAGFEEEELISKIVQKLQLMEQLLQEITDLLK